MTRFIAFISASLFFANLSVAQIDQISSTSTGLDITSSNQTTVLLQINKSDAEVYKYDHEKGSQISATNNATLDNSGVTNNTALGNSGVNQTRIGLPIVSMNFPRVRQAIIVASFILITILAKIVFRITPKLASAIPESCFLMVCGILIGFILFHADISSAKLDPNFFFICMLPPIILDAGYSMPNRLFFDNLGTILLFAVVGTIWNCFSIGLSLWGCGLTGVFGTDFPLLEVLLFAALISAVDPVAVLAVFEEIHVDEVLYIIVFGEALLNDAVGVVLYNTFNAYGVMGSENIFYTDILAGLASFMVVATSGTALGVLWGFVTGFMTRFTHHVGVVEPLLVFVASYLAYLSAEAFQISGILSITFCGITMKNYVDSNVSQDSLTTIKKSVKMFSNGSESVIFLILGVNTVHDQHVWDTSFILLTILFCTIFRVIGVLSLTKLVNRYRLRKLGRVDTFMMSYGGLRGAIAFALVLSIDSARVKNQPLFVTATIAVIYFTVFIQGITIKPLVKILKVKISSKRDKTMHERISERVFDYSVAGIQNIIGQTGKVKLREKFKQFDNDFIRPLLVRNHRCKEPKILETYSRITLHDAIEAAQGFGKSTEKFQDPGARSAHTNGAQYCRYAKSADELDTDIEMGSSGIVFSAGTQ